MHLTIVAGKKNAELLGGEQVLATIEDLVEYRRSIGHRLADHLQYLSGGGLLLERFLGLIEQSHVLDGDHGLVGKCSQEIRFLIRKSANLGASNRNRAD